jgi:multiple sugar transport system ATP-binding protein
MATVTLSAVTKSYAGNAVIHGIDCVIEDGEFVVIVGPSGCGKSTLLRMVAGLEAITGGTIAIGDRVVNQVEPKDRDIAMVFQNYALYPHMTVFQNMAYGLKIRGLSRDAIRARVDKAAEILQLGALLERTPRQLSGGQRQRVAMGRAIVREPQVFLMDEPLSNLDAKMRVQTRAEIARIQQRLGVTTIYVTHDQVEAMTMGTRVAVMRKGVLQQVDTPQFIYDNPANLFVAGFIGSPPMNLAEATLTRDAEGVWAHLGEQKLLLDPSNLQDRPGIERAVRDGHRIVLGIRPEDMEDAEFIGVAANRTLKTKVDITEALGSEVMVHFGVDAPQVFTDAIRKGGDEEESLGRIAGESGSTFVASFNARTRVRPGDLVDVAVDTKHVHFFELASGERL